MQHQLVRLTRIALDAGAETAGLSHAVSAFVRTWEGKLETHFRMEEQAVGTEAKSWVPSGLNGADSIRRERDAIAALCDLLRHRYVALARNEADARADVVAAIGDLSVVWAKHVRRLQVLGLLLAGERGERHG